MQSNYAGFGAAATDLGLGDMVVGQREEETDEQKRRRQLLDQMKEAVNPLGAMSALGFNGKNADNPAGSLVSSGFKMLRSKLGGRRLGG